RLFIADTNNSLVRYLDLNADETELRTLELKGIQPPKPKPRSFKRLRRRASADTEARSRFNVDIEPEDAVNIEPLDGFLNPEGSATLHFKRTSNSASMGRINCKSLLFEVPFREGVSSLSKADFTLAHFVKPKTSTGNLLQTVAP
ncbi:unnamed protein product, partial [Sphenostylis stenocarpa]